ncbi:PAS domain-containing sensor histidine kinase [Hyalangium minutum]|uniref:histidine kinase n=1 Tax=Hyalangium minutum TaxID=394096 RepID=A0A085W3Y7_9BACT|nr:PAS domain-containing sensor histidine kinase [Hyalangium minutum]KFE62400.1 Sensory box histidine kinase [Hyalangium minutum]
MFESLLEGAPLGIALFDTELRYLQINSRLAAMHGLSREAHLGKRLTELIPPIPARHKVVECMREVLRTEQPITGVELLYEDFCTPGRQVLTVTRFYPLRHKGRITGVYAFVEDITQRKNAERQRDELLARERFAREQAETAARELAESEARYRAILAALGEGIVVQGERGEILTVNTSAERILGLSMEQMKGLTSMDSRWRSIHEDGSPLPGEEHPAMVALRTGEPVRNVIMGVDLPDGSRVWLSVNAQPVRRSSSKPPEMVVVSFFDMTQYREALQTLYLSEQRFRSLVEATTQMVWTADAWGHKRGDSPSWRAFTGQSLEEFFSEKAWERVIHPEDLEHAKAVWREAVVRKRSFEGEERVRGHDGEYRLFHVRAVPVLAPDGSVREWIGAHTDITEARKAEEERLRLLRETQEAVQARDEFLTVAAHELRTPLTSLRLQLQLLRREARSGGEAGAQLASRCEAMERQIGRLASLISMLLDVSRLAKGQLRLELREVDLAELVDQLVEDFAGEFQRVGAVLRVRGVGTPLVGRWDPLRLEQVVVNLLSNAVRYGRGRPVELALWREGGTAVLSVKDQGIGISRADLARIFGKFERAVSERHYGGLGLGLYITRQIVDAMGGSIQVESQPGEGSTFTVQLPLGLPAYMEEGHPL